MGSGRDEATGAPGVASGPPITRSRTPFESIETETLSRRIGRRLIGDIVSGEFQPGDEIPSEDQLAREFGVSRPVVREAVKHLSVLGLVQSRQGRQSRVAPYESWNHFSPEILAARREAGAVDDVLLELLELRRMVEVEAAALAAARATPDDIDAMTAAIAVLDASVGEPQAFTRADIAFHDAIIRATKNHLLPRLFDLLRPLIEFGREISVSARPHGPTVSQQGHLAVFEAIKAGSPTEARRAMEDHLSWTANLDFGERSVRLALDDARRDAAPTPVAEDAPTPAVTGD